MYLLAGIFTKHANEKDLAQCEPSRFEHIAAAT